MEPDIEQRRLFEIWESVLTARAVVDGLITIFPVRFRGPVPNLFPLRGLIKVDSFNRAD